MKNNKLSLELKHNGSKGELKFSNGHTLVLESIPVKSKTLSEVKYFMKANDMMDFWPKTRQQLLDSLYDGR